jgi:hypothetical protein
MDLFHAAHAITGLWQMDRDFTIARVPWITSSLALQVKVDGIRVGLELSDHSNVFANELLERCDIYFKRSYYGPDLINVSPSLRRKVVPFGLNYACCSKRSMIKMLRAIGVRTIPVGSIYRAMVMPTWKAFEYGAAEQCDETILFQARLWAPEEAPGDSEVNIRRVALLRALRREFGERVVGGLVPTPYACEAYPDLLTNLPCRQPAYIRAAKQPLVGIYFRGLFDSIAFKLGEYLAASKCIVSEPIRNRLPVPMENGRHMLVFTSNEQCLSECERLLSSPRLAQELRRTASEYYRTEVMPETHMRNIIKRAYVERVSA